MFSPSLRKSRTGALASSDNGLDLSRSALTTAAGSAKHTLHQQGFDKPAPSWNFGMVPVFPDTPQLMRKCACGGTCNSCKEDNQKKTALQRKTAGSPGPNQVPSIVHDVLRSPGRPLDVASRSPLEQRFGHDFSHVRLHTDDAAAASATAVNALAYTSGSHIVFNRGQYVPSGPAGENLLAHELAHVVQQRNASGLPREILNASHPLERAADQAATRVTSDRTPAKGNKEDNVGGNDPVIARRVAGVNCPPNQDGAPPDPRGELETADTSAIDATTQMATDLATDAQTVRGGIPATPTDSLQAFQNHFGLPPAASTGFLNRLTGAVRPSQEVALSEELAIVSRRFAGVARIMGQGLSYNCPGNKSLSLIGCTPGTCGTADAFSCPGNSLVALCQSFWGFDDDARGQVMAHEAFHITLGNIGVGSILDATTPGSGRNFNIAGCYEILLQDRSGHNSGAGCPAVPA